MRPIPLRMSPTAKNVDFSESPSLNNIDSSHGSHGRLQDFSRGGQIHRRSQGFSLDGRTFSHRKLTSLKFLVIALKTQAKTTK